MMAFCRSRRSRRCLASLTLRVGVERSVPTYIEWGGGDMGWVQ